MSRRRVQQEIGLPYSVCRKKIQQAHYEQQTFQNATQQRQEDNMNNNV